MEDEESFVVYQEYYNRIFKKWKTKIP
jgi:hypothetical protein